MIDDILDEFSHYYNMLLNETYFEVKKHLISILYYLRDELNKVIDDEIKDD